MDFVKKKTVVVCTNLLNSGVLPLIGTILFRYFLNYNSPEDINVQKPLWVIPKLLYLCNHFFL